MKTPFLLLAFLSLLLFSCKKTDATEQASIDDAKIQSYISANKLTMQKDASGLYYQIVTEGSGTAPTTASTIRVAYTGSVLNGAAFATSANYTTLLSGTIQGWQIGLPYIKPGGRIFLLVPSALAYGTKGYGTIPSNTVLMFTIDLFEVQG